MARRSERSARKELSDLDERLHFGYTNRRDQLVKLRRSPHQSLGFSNRTKTSRVSMITF